MLTVDQEISCLEDIVFKWLQESLDMHAPGLSVSKEKTRIVVFSGGNRAIVNQSKRMRRIQGAISGGFDAVAGQDILYSIQGLIRSQKRYSEERLKEGSWAFSPIPDVRDETVARFAAGRFRSTFRSLRPLLEDCSSVADPHNEALNACQADGFGLPRTQAELDDEVRAFALGLIETWVEDPSNVRLLRIGLDLWPAEDVLKSVLDLLRPFTEPGGRRKAPRRVAWYCLSEIFRAGATETGFVEDPLSLPSQIDIAAYRSVLLNEAKRLVSLPSATLPWYLRQQVLLFLAANNPAQAPIFRPGRSAETKHYRELIRFLRGESQDLSNSDFATLAILCRRSFLTQDAAVMLAQENITLRRLDLITQRDPDFGMEIFSANPMIPEELLQKLRNDPYAERKTSSGNGEVSLSELVLHGGPNGPLRNELAILSFARHFLDALSAQRDKDTVIPSDVFVRISGKDDQVAQVDNVKIAQGRSTRKSSMYRPPSWCPPEEYWRFQLGYLLRFILAGKPDFTQIIRPRHWKEGTATYRAPGSHWYQRLYGLYNGHSAFGDDWLPISEWIEQLLFALLHWPGCRDIAKLHCVREGIARTCELIKERHEDITNKRGKLSRILILPLDAPRFDEDEIDRPLRVCIAQTVIPTPADFSTAADEDDLTLSNPIIRRRHRNHLSAALAAIRRLLILRETHKGHDGRLDWLILPELSVHPRDVETHLIPFARAHKAMITVGMTYHEILAAEPLVNSALWLIPAWSEGHGLEIHIRRQGKYHLSPEERSLNNPNQRIRGFRPCQWLVNYQWCRPDRCRPLRLTASICYDSTDISLAADLRSHSDIFAVPALNKDVNTFDNMALALHYHMFQMVIVANNGSYGGSNAYAPYKDHYKKQVFHLHGQPQATVAFLEIEDIHQFIQRKDDAHSPSPESCPWKSPPAGL